MHNTTFLTKLTLRNSFLALFFNLEVAVVHKSKMAAITEPLKYICEQKQMWNYIAGQTFSVDLFSTCIQRDHLQ